MPHRSSWSAVALALATAVSARAEIPGARNPCVGCHEHLTPGIVSDWRLSRHAQVNVACQECHGDEHRSEQDAARAVLPSPATCQGCHPAQVEQFSRGKHARAWDAVEAIPTFHYLERSAPGDRSGCATCHRIGLRSPARTAGLRETGMTHGLASCDACHTRHTFSVAEARRPEACKACHGDGDHMQWNAWAASKHGVLQLLLQRGDLPAGAAAPTCQRCHMPGADHAVRAPSGSLGLRLPLPPDKGWAADRAILFRALGVLDAKGGEGPRLRAVTDSGTAVLEKLDYENEQARLEQVCLGCHAARFVREEVGRRDVILRGADHVVAEAVRVVVPLYERKLLPPTANGRFPDLTAAGERTPIERRLSAMFFDLRARLVATAFHGSPAWASWKVALDRELAEIRREAKAELGRGKRAAAP
jgi:hypothetical protein